MPAAKKKELTGDAKELDQKKKFLHPTFSHHAPIFQQAPSFAPREFFKVRRLSALLLYT